MATITATPTDIEDTQAPFARIRFWVDDAKDENDDLLPLNERIWVESEWRVVLSAGDPIRETYTSRLIDHEGLTPAEKLSIRDALVTCWRAGKAQGDYA